MSVTPSATARAVRARRSLRANSPRTAILRMVWTVLGRWDSGRGRLGGTRGLAVLDELAVAQDQQAIRVGGGLLVVGDHDDRLAELVDRAPQQLQDLGRAGRVEVAGRLVGEPEGRPRGERAHDRDALLLAARELARAVGDAVAEADQLDQLVDPAVVGVAAGD